MKILLSLLMIWLSATSVLAFDFQHGAFDALLKKHVRWNQAGVASQVDYAGFLKDREPLDAYLAELSRVAPAEFDSWSKPARLAFLINAYNGFTIQLILSRYPDLDSIKDLGSFFSSPWSKEFFTLLGEQRSLDALEHEMIRAPGVYADPRIHAAVVCASIGCPGLRDEAFTDTRLEEQLEDSLRRFLSDRSRNRYNPRTETLEVSKIFDWYGTDFSSGYRGHDTLRSFLGDYAEQLATDPHERRRISAGQAEIRFLSYDWSLNQPKD